MRDRAPAVRRRGAAAAVGLAGVAAIVFASAARLPFVSDDYAYLEIVRQPGWWHSGTVWNPRGAPINHIYRPILLLWFGLLDHLFGLHPLVFHVATGCLVVAAGLMTGLVARRIGLQSGAYAAAAIFCLHASMATPVGWTSAASSPLATGLGLAAIYCLLRPRVRPSDVGVACGLFLVALMTREVVAVAPVILIMTRWLVEEVHPWPARLKRCMLASLPLWLVLIGYASVRRASGFTSTGGQYTQAVTAHAFHNLGQLMQYATEFGYSLREGWFVTLFWVVLIGLCAAATRHSRRFQAPVGLVWALLGVLPVIFLTRRPMDSYYIDFALPGLAIAIGAVFEWIFAAIPARARVAIPPVCLAVLAVVGAFVARQEEHTYLDPQARGTRLLIEKVRLANPDPAPGSTIVLPMTAAAAAYSDYGDLFRVVYDDPSLNVAYAG